MTRSQYKRIKAPAWDPAESNYKEATKRAGRRINSNCMAKYYSPEPNFRDLLLLIAFELPNRRLEQELTV